MASSKFGGRLYYDLIVPGALLRYEGLPILRWSDEGGPEKSLQCIIRLPGNI